MLAPFITEQIIRYYSENSTIDIVTAKEIERNNEREAEFDYSLVKDVEAFSVVQGAMEFDKDFMVGILKIPDLNVNLPIFKGITNSNLMAGVATMKRNQSMGLGNYALAGHYMKNKDLLLGSLMDIKVGSTVTLTDKQNIYEYRIYETAVVPDTAVDMILDEEAEKRGKPIVSLMTCYYSSKTGKRFFAMAELVDQYPTSDYEKD